MGKAIDSQYSVYSVKGLYVVDTRIMLLSITACLQASIDAVTKTAVDLIGQAA